MYSIKIFFLFSALITVDIQGDKSEFNQCEHKIYFLSKQFSLLTDISHAKLHLSQPLLLESNFITKLIDVNLAFY